MDRIKYFLGSTAYTVPTRRLARRERKCKWLICGGPCRGRTYGPLIKSSEQSKSEQTQHDLTPQQTEDSKKSIVMTGCAGLGYSGSSVVAAYDLLFCQGPRLKTSKRARYQ